MTTTQEIQTIEQFWRTIHGERARYRMAQKKSHTCGQCRGTIHVGDRYFDTGEVVGQWATAKCCDFCAHKPEGATAIERAIVNHGYTVRYVKYCEDAQTPGLLGQIAGVTDHQRREVKVGLEANADPARMLQTLEHELRHITEPDWDCGNRDVLGRGGR